MFVLKKIILPLLLLFSLYLKAQKKITNIYSLNQCIDLSLKNNEQLKSSNLNINYQRQLKKTSTEIPKTNISFTQGQFNSIYKYDNNFTISQVIPNPWVFKSNNSLAEAKINSSVLKYEDTKANLIYQIKVSYYSLLYSIAVNAILFKEDSIYEDFAHAVNEKYKTAQASILEKTTVETQVMEIKNQVTESEVDVHNFQIQLQTLMQVNNGFEIEEIDFSNNYLSYIIKKDSVSEHPILKYLSAQIEMNNKSKNLEQVKNLPDIMGGYFNQSIFGPANIYGPGNDYNLTTSDRLQGFILGITVPLWYYPLKSKIKASEINIKLAESDFNYNFNLLEGQYRQAVAMYLKYRNSLNYYKTDALPNLNIILKQAVSSYNAKEISYIDYLEVVSRALNIKRNYLYVVHQNNLWVLKLDYLVSN